MILTEVQIKRINASVKTKHKSQTQKKSAGTHSHRRRGSKRRGKRRETQSTSTQRLSLSLSLSRSPLLRFVSHLSLFSFITSLLFSITCTLNFSPTNTKRKNESARAYERWKNFTSTGKRQQKRQRWLVRTHTRTVSLSLVLSPLLLSHLFPLFTIWYLLYSCRIESRLLLCLPSFPFRVCV